MMIPPAPHDTTLHGTVGRISECVSLALSIGAILLYWCFQELVPISSPNIHTFIKKASLYEFNSAR
jgi:hypothetical protein